MKITNDPRRLANAKNLHQGNFKKILCVCSAGLLRSPTLAWILSNPPYNCNTRACGTSQQYALIPIDNVLVHWADEIVCVNEDHIPTIRELLKDNPFIQEEKKKKIWILNIPDEFETRDPDLIRIIESELRRVGFTNPS